MSFEIRKAAVLGAGIMGSGIAAHLANAGIPSILLDIVPPKAAEGEDTESAAFRNKFAAGALEKLKKSKPAAVYSKSALDLIEIGNFDDDMGRLEECDWVVEAIVENLDIKQSLFAKVEANIRPGTVVSSNTSGLQIEAMLEGRGESFRQHFLVTHFFNPVRYMKLLELVAGKETDPDVMDAMHHFGEEVLGKGIVYGKDTVNFVANRIGVYGIMKTLDEMAKAELTVEEIDKIFGKAMGRPKTAVFRTADLVGVDTFHHVAKNCYDNLTADEEREIFKAPEFLDKMVEKNLLGNKTRQGFYKKTKDDEGNRVILSLDLTTLEYTEQQKVSYKSLGKAKGVDDVKKRVARFLSVDDKAAQFAERVTLATLAYTSRRIPEIADDVVNIDRAMRWGFNWELGPFETWDAYGVQKGLDRMAELGIEPAPWVAEMVASGRESFYAWDGLTHTYWDIDSKGQKEIPENDRAFSLEVLRRGEKVVESNRSATLWDMGDGVALLEFHSKMNAIDDNIIKMFSTAIDVVERDFLGLVIGNEATNFSVGANIMLVLMAANQGQWGQIEELVATLQNTAQRARYCKVPVVSAPAGMALGGGAEITMCGNAVQAAAESYIGLVEVGVGLIPGGSGTLQLLRNLFGRMAGDREVDPFPFIRKAFLTIGMASVATSAEEAMEKGFLNLTDGISLNRDFHLSDAKARVIGMAKAGFRPPRPAKFYLPGPSGKATVDMLLYDMELNNNISAHDRLIGNKLATVLTGGDTSPKVAVTEERLLELEREAFVSLCGEQKTRDRIAYMLQNNKPLRN